MTPWNLGKGWKRHHPLVRLFHLNLRAMLFPRTRLCRLMDKSSGAVRIKVVGFAYGCRLPWALHNLPKVSCTLTPQHFPWYIEKHFQQQCKHCLMWDLKTTNMIYHGILWKINPGECMPSLWDLYELPYGTHWNTSAVKNTLFLQNLRPQTFWRRFAPWFESHHLNTKTVVGMSMTMTSISE